MFKGSIVALVTPFNNDLSLNYERITELIEWHIEKGTDGFVICGTTAEATTLSTDEKLSVINHAVKIVDKRVPVIAGTGSNNTSEAVKLSVEAEALGVDGLLIITPYYLKTNQEGIKQHFTAVANWVTIPIILYNVPSRTNVNLEPEIVEELSCHPNIIGIKEASGDLEQISKIMFLAGKDFLVFSGSDDLNVEILELGAAGMISVLANILPSETHMLYQNVDSGKLSEARLLQSKYIELINLLFVEPNPIPIKVAMNKTGFDVGGYRLPLWTMERINKEKLVEEIRKHNIGK